MTVQRSIVSDNNELKIDKHGNALVTIDVDPPIHRSKTVPFRQFLTIDGAVDGAFDMRAAGTLADPIDYYIEAHQTRDRYITQLSFEISDAGATLDKFGTIAALTNGCRLFFKHHIAGEIDLHPALKSNWDFIRLCAGNPAFGSGADTFRAKNVSGTAEGYIPILDLKTFGPGLGIKLDFNTRQRLSLQVRDTTTGVDSFNVIAYGFERLPD